MANGAFQHRSGRVISLARLSLAVLFLVAIWADPSQPSHYPIGAYGVLAAYAALSAAYLALTWNNWWTEHRFAVLTHAFDILLFGAMVYLTEGYTSPFFTFFVFLILSATIRWGWRETAATAAVVTVVFLVAGLIATRWDEAAGNVTRMLVRGVYLLVLSLLLIWFSFNQRRSLLDRLAAGDITGRQAGAEPPIRAGLEEAIARTGARRAALLWWDAEEPWLNVAALEDGRMREARHPPGHFGPLVDARLAGGSFLFDCHKQRVLLDGPGGIVRIPHIREPFAPQVAQELHLGTGLAVPVTADTHGGLFILSDIPGLCADDIKVGERLGQDFVAALRRSSVVGISEAAAENRTRVALARDLHDSIVQLLSGTSMRLQGIRHAVSAGRDADHDIKTLQDELAREQKGLRKLIGELRSGAVASERRPLCTMVEESIASAGRQWGISPDLVECPPELEIGTALQHEIGQLLREAIANAAKHGKATQVWVTVGLAGSFLALAVRDNGSGFADACSPGPRTLTERMEELGGSVHLESSSEGSTITLTLPWD